MSSTSTRRPPRLPRQAPPAELPEDALLERALAPVQDALEAVTERILAELADPTARAVVYLITAGGKRLRPALVLLAGSSGSPGIGPRPSAVSRMVAEQPSGGRDVAPLGAGAQVPQALPVGLHVPDRDALIRTAAAVELIHTATLIHDDIIDGSTVRRSQPTFHRRWGTERAVLMGDYLYATAFTMLARLDSPGVMQIMADVCRQLCRGELREVEARYRLDLTEEDYFDIIRDKTASLIGGCCRSGASLGGCPPQAIERLSEFGVTFGLVFQIIDDCLDLTGDPGRLGKSILSDLDKGALSLPIIYLSQALSAKERDRLFAPLRTQAADPAFLRRIAEAAQETGAVAKAHARARSLIQSAHETLAHAPLNGLKESYRQLADYAVSRRS